VYAKGILRQSAGVFGLFVSDDWSCVPLVAVVGPTVENLCQNPNFRAWQTTRQIATAVNPG
jgi:hypothetical protein